MYLSLRRDPSPDQNSRFGDPRRVSRNVVMLGLTSLFTDISSEMVVAILPIYLTITVGWSTIAYGLFDGLFSVIDASFRLVGGATADRTRNHKQVATAGYALSGATRIGLIMSTIVALPVIPFLLIERVGKGLRSAPRDALISLSTEPSRLGLAFGVHRALDTTGALIGPFVAFWLLSMVPGSFDSIFVVSFVFAVIGVLVIAGLVERRPVAQPIRRVGAVASLRSALATPDTARTAGIAFLLGAMTISDGFIYLIIQRQASVSMTMFPLLYAAGAVVYLVLAIPIGALADRVGRGRVFVAGHGALVVLYLALMRSDQFGGREAALCLLLLGLYYACTDGVLAAVVSAQSSDHLRSSAIATVGVATSLGRFVSSLAFGAAWLRYGLSGPLLVFTIGLVVVAAIATNALPGERTTRTQA